MLERLRVLESFVGLSVDSCAVRCLAVKVLRQHVAVALTLETVALVLVLILVALLTSLSHVQHKMRPIVTAVTWPIYVSVCLSAGHEYEPCKNGSIERNDVWWNTDADWSTESLLDGGPVSPE